MKFIKAHDLNEFTYENLKPYNGFSTTDIQKDNDGRLSGVVANLPKGNCLIFQGYSLKELEEDFHKAIDSYTLKSR